MCVNKTAQTQTTENVFGRAVNLLAYAFGGSNPPLSTNLEIPGWIQRKRGLLTPKTCTPPVINKRGAANGSDYCDPAYFFCAALIFAQRARWAAAILARAAAENFGFLRIAPVNVVPLP